MERALLTSDRAILAGDLNLDMHRIGEYNMYKKCTVMEAFLQDTAAIGYVYSPTVETFFVSYGQHGKDRVNHSRCLDHVYTARIKERTFAVSMVNNWTTDHHPILAVINGIRSLDANGLTTMKQEL
jgi:endonuclease/exonuclease/phosphatase family metal-dependent hydrolase